MNMIDFMNNLRIGDKPFRPYPCQVRLMKIIDKEIERSKRTGEKPRLIIFKGNGRPWASTFPGVGR